MKLTSHADKPTNTQFVDADLCTAFNNKLFGKQTIDNIHLCEISAKVDADGFYPCHISLQIN